MPYQSSRSVVPRSWLILDLIFFFKQKSMEFKSSVKFDLKKKGGGGGGGNSREWEEGEGKQYIRT